MVGIVHTCLLILAISYASISIEPLKNDPYVCYMVLLHESTTNI